MLSGFKRTAVTRAVWPRSTRTVSPVAILRTRTSEPDAVNASLVVTNVVAGRGEQWGEHGGEAVLCRCDSGGGSSKCLAHILGSSIKNYRRGGHSAATQLLRASGCHDVEVGTLGERESVAGWVSSGGGSGSARNVGSDMAHKAQADALQGVAAACGMRSWGQGEPPIDRQPKHVPVALLAACFGALRAVQCASIPAISPAQWESLLCLDHLAASRQLRHNLRRLPPAAAAKSDCEMRCCCGSLLASVGRSQPKPNLWPSVLCAAGGNMADDVASRG